MTRRSLPAAAGHRPAPLPSNETERLQALQQLGVLDTAPEQAYDDLTELAATVCGTPIALITLVDAERQWFKSRVGLPVTQTPRDLAFCAHAILRPDQILEVRDAQSDERFAGNPLVLGEPGIRFYAGAPLVTPGGQAVGTLCVIDRQPRQLDERQRRALASLARQVMSQLELHHTIATLEQQSLTDSLTGVWNRRGFDRRLRSEWALHGRNRHSLALLMIDVDRFKAFNDRFGHLSGDQALAQVAHAVQLPLRISDTLARYGGEEFALVLPQVGAADALTIAERVRQAVAGSNWPLRQVTVSIGVAVAQPAEEPDRHLLVARADRALYLAKQNGRNRAEPFQGWESEPPR